MIYYRVEIKETETIYINIPPPHIIKEYCPHVSILNDSGNLEYEVLERRYNIESFGNRFTNRNKFEEFFNEIKHLRRDEVGYFKLDRDQKITKISEEDFNQKKEFLQKNHFNELKKQKFNWIEGALYLMIESMLCWYGEKKKIKERFNNDRDACYDDMYSFEETIREFNDKKNLWEYVECTGAKILLNYIVELGKEETIKNLYDRIDRLNMNSSQGNSPAHR